MITLQLSAREFRLLCGCYATLVIMRLDAETGRKSTEGIEALGHTFDEMSSLGVSGLDRLRGRLQKIIEAHPNIARGVVR